MLLTAVTGLGGRLGAAGLLLGERHALEGVAERAAAELAAVQGR